MKEKLEELKKTVEGCIRATEYDKEETLLGGFTNTDWYDGRISGMKLVLKDIEKIQAEG